MSELPHDMDLSQAEANVRTAYRWILGREADRAGLENYRDMLARGDIDVSRLREIFIQSDEFRGYEKTDIERSTYRNTVMSDVIFIQTADAGSYRLLLEATARTVVEYCRRNGFEYQSFVGMKRGFHPWQASFNRYYMLMDLVRAGYTGWAVYMDSDAWIHDLSFDLRTYLGSHADRAGILTPVAPHLPETDVNNGVMFLNLGDPRAVAVINQCIARYEAVSDQELIALENWPGDINDQMFLAQTLSASDGLRRAFYYESNSLMNERDASFIRTLLRLHYPAMKDRLTAIRVAVESIVSVETETPEVRMYPAAMSAIYRGLLGREPDEGGLNHFRSRFEQKGFERALLETVIETTLSQEFKVRHGID